MLCALATCLAASVASLDEAFQQSRLTLHQKGVGDPPGPCSRNKTLHLIRHAEGLHNVDELTAERDQVYLKDPYHARLREEFGIAWVLLERVSGRKYHDPLLTPLGREQAYQLRSALRAEGDFAVDAVVSSPMRRTIETALLSLPQFEDAASSFRLEAPGSPPQLPDFLVSDLLRERVGPFMCDSRLTRSELEREYGSLRLGLQIDFAGIEEADEMFANGLERHEPEVGSARLANRAATALEWILDSVPGSNVAVLAHKHILAALVSKHAGVSQRPFDNAERRTVVLCEAADMMDDSRLKTVRPIQGRVSPLGGAEP
jgi:broad specificity phosphatase PhoE